MGRPVKWRRVDHIPTTLHFLPAPEGDGKDENGKNNENVLLLEEYEAIRLKDLEGLEQEECAEQMQISRPTFQRILATAHQKVADSLIHGKGILISGGNATRGICPVRCLDCGYVWEDRIETLNREKTDYACPRCHSTRIVCAPVGPRGNGRGMQNRFCQRGCWRSDWSRQLDNEESERETHAEHHDPD